MGKVLFVDDHIDTADMLANIALELGHSVSVAYDGATASWMASQQIFDLVFLDISLPDVDGRDVCSQIRCGLSRHARIVAITGRAEIRTSGELSGFDDWLIKPISMHQIEHLLTAP
ncbi:MULTISPECIES: response regulator transcription factor [Caballeronia]|uniref:Histidine kinase n=1 Tax=Caballeronia zhejiangensis TaxID=871203 RepID=A0A656QDR0_9BURK|nr:MULTISPECIES: response regulator [Caballeronia]KDR28421.1 histidine kinase [Caballeronia zhejiangensis]MCE4547768.1 response regulator [Caballeronia sp. PC1]MCE4575678.1 response regulator [Caballeronia sp. CLC5]